MTRGGQFNPKKSKTFGQMDSLPLAANAARPGMTRWSGKDAPGIGTHSLRDALARHAEVRAERASKHARGLLRVTARRMDGRVKPGHDDKMVKRKALAGYRKRLFMIIRG